MLVKIGKTLFTVASIPVLIIVFFCMMLFTVALAVFHTTSQIIEEIWK